MITQKNYALVIYIGALSDPISIQLDKQGYKYKFSEVRKFQKFTDAITLLKIHGILSDAERVKAEQRLYKKLKLHVESML